MAIDITQKRLWFIDLIESLRANARDGQFYRMFQFVFGLQETFIYVIFLWECFVYKSSGTFLYMFATWFRGTHYAEMNAVHFSMMAWWLSLPLSNMQCNFIVFTIIVSHWFCRWLSSACLLLCKMLCHRLERCKTFYNGWIFKQASLSLHCCRHSLKYLSLSSRRINADWKIIHFCI